MQGILKDLVVIELASVLAGPSVGQFFAEQGATVIKIENPKTSGDVTRSWRVSSEQTEDSRSAYFNAINWGKRSIALDLRQGDDFDLLKSLVAKADIVLSSYKNGDSEKLGVNFEFLSAFNEKIILGEITGFGSENRVAYDAIVQAESGMMFINGDEEPTKLPVALIDVLAAHQLKEGLLLALLSKKKNKSAQRVQVSLIDTAISALSNQASNWLNIGAEPRRMGNEHPNIAPYGSVFKTGDGKSIMLAVSTDKQFAELCKVLCVELPSAMKKNVQRVRERELVNQYLQKAMAKQNAEPLKKQLLDSNVPFGEIRSVSSAINTYASHLLYKELDQKGLSTSVFLKDKPKLKAPPKLDEDREWVMAFVGKK